MTIQDRVFVVSGRLCLLVGGLALLGTACEASPPLSAPEVASLHLEDGSLVSDLASEDDTVVVLVFDPDDCFVCAGFLPTWRSEDVKNPDRYRLILTRRPDRHERRSLAAARIHVDGILERNETSRLQPPLFLSLGEQHADVLARPTAESITLPFPPEATSASSR